MTLSMCRRASHVETAPPQLLHVSLDCTSSLLLLALKQTNRTKLEKRFEGDMIMDSTKDMEHEPELERELVAEEGAKGATLVAEDELVAEEELVPEEALIAPTGPMTRSRVKLFNQAIGGMLNHIWDRPNDLSQVTTSLVLIHAQGPHQDG
ncbi:hypothetical protein ISN45_Aa07g032600 [Arabidopsis thaliana x Arabidopsis arenosa]|uniref:Uncharacterized protein n=1 Tax=Arabidopsis thaliana x Arabidopsis arenosa TaxID=1240361 RepID=A0A8T1Y870_9BRAS|nr:hypothetical protein ISN45_Aa07g032600 [Arabidopsis thaliana x Arabidopsis arenosa]